MFIYKPLRTMRDGLKMRQGINRERGEPQIDTFQLAKLAFIREIVAINTLENNF